MASSISKTTISTAKAVNPPKNIMTAERQIAAVLNIHTTVEKKSLIMIISTTVNLIINLNST